MGKRARSSGEHEFRHNPGCSWDDSDSCDCADAEEDPRGSDAGDVLIEHLLWLLWTGVLSAKAVCVIAFWVHRSGATENVGKLGYKPQSQTGKFMRHVDNFNKDSRRKHWTMLKVPGQLKSEAARKLLDVAVLQPHEELESEMVGDEEFRTKLCSCIEKRELPPSYFESEVVRNSDKPVAPIAIFLDGVVYSAARRVTVLGIWIINTITQMRHLSIVYRLNRLCSCGCKGWCTYFALLNFIRWSLNAAASGKHPLLRWDHSPWHQLTEIVDWLIEWLNCMVDWLLALVD